MAFNQTFTGVIGRTVKESVPSWPLPPRAPQGAPNIVLVVLDDVGFADLGCYGSEIETPTLDRLANGGLRFTNFHTTALCSPTRACLLTGRNHHSVGMGMLASWDSGFPGLRGRIAPSAGTLAEILQEQGYNTFATGKWHLAPSASTSASGPYNDWPLQRGFERYYGFLAAATNHWYPSLTHDNHHIEIPEEPGYHLTTDIIDHSIAFIRDQKALDREKPFFLYTALGACHAPHHVPAEYVEKYEDVFAKGWDQTRRDRFARQKQLGIIPPETVLSPPNDDVVQWNLLGDDARKVAVRLQAAYAGMLDHADYQLGRLITFLEQLNQLNNTLIFVVSDNGASREGTEHGTINAMRYFNNVPDNIEDNLAALNEIGSASLINNYPLGWAMAGNTPLKRYKGNAHGGGVRDPLIVHYPVEITDRGGIRSQFHHAIDLVPTVLEIIGIEAPRELKGFPQQQIEGTSLRYTFDQKVGPSAKNTQYFEIVGHRGIWHRGWKAVTWHRPGTSFDNDKWELYNLEDDFSESHDLASERPEHLRALIDLWWSEAGRYQVLPLNDAPRWFGDEEMGGLPLPCRYELLPKTSRIPGEAAPDIRNRSYSITAQVHMGNQNTQGILIAHGDSASGYALYISNGRLVHDYNFVGTHFVIASNILVPQGRHTLRFDFTAIGNHSGVGHLWIDSNQVGQVEMPTTLRRLPQWSGLYIGYSPLLPIDNNPRPFPFSGVIERIVIELEPGRGIDMEAHLASDLSAQ